MRKLISLSPREARCENTEIRQALQTLKREQDRLKRSLYIFLLFLMFLNILVCCDHLLIIYLHGWIIWIVFRLCHYANLVG